MKLSSGICIILFFFGVTKGQEPSPTPEPIREEVIVTANKIETRISDTPASVVTFSRVEIESAAAPTIDDTLRQSAGFSIFRRSSSRNANPTTQGVSLRGVGSSGASRTIVLLDGVPLNDPFGGWVQWNRVSPIAVESIEILRGGASSLYGDAGLSGAINILPRKIEPKYIFTADVFGGTQGTLSGSGFAGFNAGRWLADIDAASFQTKGFRPVDEAVRGPVDVFAGVRSSNFSTRVVRKFIGQSSIFARPSYFGEVRTNGTGLQTNRTHIRQIVVGGDIRTRASAVNFSWRSFAGSQVYDQIFSAVNAARTGESLTRVQRVPAQTAGGSAQFSFVYKDHTILTGIEIRNVRGSSDEIGFANNSAASNVGAGGRENAAGVFLHDFIKIGQRLVVAGGLRFDRWRNYRALISTRILATGQVTTAALPDRTEAAVSPRISALYHLSDRFSLYANASRSFRSPTLNELYRGFRVGNVVTLANERLEAEKANNIEAGVSVRLAKFSLRTNGFWTNIDRPIVNVTLTATPNLITRQRQNAGSTRSAGFEVEAEMHIKQASLSAGYLFADATVTSFSSNPLIEGRMIPQVARHQFTFQARYSPAKWIFAVQTRASGSQFDDDLNLFRLEPYVQVDVFAAKRIIGNLQIYAAVENIFNTRYSVGRTPVRTVSSPTNFRTGFRW